MEPQAVSVPGPATEPPPLTGVVLIAEQLHRVYELRRLRDTYAALLQTRREAFDRDNAQTLLALREEENRVEAAEAAARALALAHYRDTGEATPTPGIAVKLFDILDYEPERAFAWAREKQMALVPESLNVKAFEKIAKATALEFVTVKQTPKVQIATDLAKALGVVPSYS